MTDVEWLRHNTMPAENYRMDRIAARYEAMEKALELIAEYGGEMIEEGLLCNGSWCAEQARSALGEKP